MLCLKKAMRNKEEALVGPVNDRRAEVFLTVVLRSWGEIFDSSVMCVCFDFSY